MVAESTITVDEHEYGIPPSLQERIPLFLMHIASYRSLLQYLHNLVILDIGCGYGYGSFMLSTVAKKVVGIDISEERIHYAKNTYKALNLEFLCVDALQYSKKFKEEPFDSVIAMEFIEHINNTKEFLKSTLSLLKDDGLMILATPNRLFRLDGRGKPWNPEHFKEYDSRTLKELLKKYFTDLRIFGLSGSEEAYKWEKARIGEGVPFKLKILWRYVPETIRRILRKKINFKLKDNRLTLNDYYVEDEVDFRTFTLIAFCRGPRYYTNPSY